MRTYYLIHRHTGMAYRLEGQRDDCWIHADGFSLRLDYTFDVFYRPMPAIEHARDLLLTLPRSPMRAKLLKAYNKRLEEAK